MSAAKDFGFEIGQQVTIIPIDVLGRVDAVMHEMDCVQYRVVYWLDSRRVSEWVYGYEIKSVQTQKAIQVTTK